MGSSVGQAVDVIILAGITGYTVLTFGYIFVMWHIRHNFFIALR